MDSRSFEQEVHRVASALWPSAAARPNSYVGHREVDGVYETEDAVHLVESTTRPDKQKAMEDGKKLLDNVKVFQRKRPQKAIKGWFITLRPPSPDQHQEIDKHNNPALVAVSFADFQAKIINAREYVSLRRNHPFGSARHPATQAIDAGPYVPLDIQEVGTADVLSVGDIADALVEGDKLSLFGDFGAGKSMTLREVFLHLTERHLRNKDVKFPIHLNLRDHKGQDSAEEALLRHAERLGFTAKYTLIRAWRAGYAYVLLDGFDELSSFSWQGDFHRVVEFRRRALALVRQFTQETTPGTGVLVAGRSHYFDSRREAEQALGAGTPLRRLSLNEFSDEQIASYLAKHGWRDPIPEWVPARPLLLGILATRNLLGTLLGLGEDKSPAQSWDHVLGEIFNREAAQQASLDGLAIRGVVERLAAVTRGSADGVGPIYADDLARMFTHTLGYPPDEEALQVLLRLPLLGIRDEGDGSRQFVDLDLVDILRGGLSSEYIVSPYQSFEGLEPEGWSAGLRAAGQELLEHRLIDQGVETGRIQAALGQAHVSRYDGFGMDAFRALLTRQDAHVGAHIEIRGQEVDELELGAGAGDYSRVTIRDCLIERLDLEGLTDAAKAPRLRDCIISVVSGPRSETEVPSQVLTDCEVVEYAQRTATTQGIMELGLPLGARVTLTIVKKLYAQRGTGRLESALKRGLDQRARSLVGPVLDLLATEGFAVKMRASRGPVWLPARDKAKDARKILANPTVHSHPVLRAGAELAD